MQTHGIAISLMSTVVGNVIGDTSSNPGRGCLDFRLL